MSEDELWEILREEYGIRTMEDLIRAKRRQKKIDISGFVKREKVAYERKGETICKVEIS